MEAGRGLAAAAVRQGGGGAVARQSLYRHPRTTQLLALSFLFLFLLFFLFVFVLLDDGALADAVSVAHQAFGGGIAAAAPVTRLLGVLRGEYNMELLRPKGLVL